MSADRLLVRGGRVVDGAGAEPHRADVLIVDGVIAEIGDALDSGAGDRVLDADDLLSFRASSTRTRTPTGRCSDPTRSGRCCGRG